MMLQRYCLGVCLVTLLSACGMGRFNEPETIGQLKGKPFEVVQRPVSGDTREQAKKNYDAFLASGDDNQLRPEAMRRLADLRLEDEQARQAEAAVSELQGVDHESTILMYQTLLRDYPNYPHKDKALYQLARAYEDSGKTELALQTLEQLVREHPSTALRAEAEFRRGEVLFVDRNYRGAELAYAAVLATGADSPFYERALYKQGWARFKQSFYDEALDAFIMLLDRRLAQGTEALDTMTRAERELMDDSLRVVSLSFSYQEGAASVGEYFQRRGERKYEDLIYANLGQLYLGKERYTDAAEVFNAFVARHPLHRQAPAFQVQVMAAYQAGGFPSLVLEAKKDFVERYALTGPYWKAHDQSEVPEVVAALKSNIHDLARHYHALAQQSKKPTDYAEAARWYQAFLDSFPQSEETPHMNFMLAEIYFESQQFDRAAQAYEKTAYDYPAHDKGGEAGYAALLAYDKHAATLPAGERAAWQRRSIDSAQRFAERYPQHPQAYTVLTKASEDLFKLGEFAAAIQAAQKVTEAPQASLELRRTAWTVVAHASFDLQDFQRAEGAYQQSLNLLPAQDPSRQPLVERLAAAIYRQGEQARAAGDLRAAADHFTRVGRNAPGASIAVTADYDAAAVLLELRDWQQSTQQLEAFRQQHPQHELQAEVTRKLAVAYLETGQAPQAAVEFERVARDSDDPQLQRQALWQAAELYEQAQMRSQAIAAWQAFAQRFPSPLESAIEARQHVIDLHAANGAGAERLAAIAELVKAEAAGRANERTDRTRYLAALGALELAGPTAQAYRQIALKAPLKQNLELKKRRMQQAVDAYTQIANYGVAEAITAATYEIGAIYRHFGQALLKSERPAGLSADELAQYDILLEEQAYPFEEKAIEVHEANVARIASGIYDEWIKKSLQQLAELLPARYGKQERGEAHVAELR